ncbi:hypothetical protein [Baekduia alba]|uniref:hypothetical protein n=1 Tax=Baekduia alba TaxID=2997333 RepID=UPI0023405228|nr:hypothetical protein [Baekduia alba]
MNPHEQARQRRGHAAAAYRPRDVRLLLIAEAPPSDLDRYFYFEQVRDQDSLFRYVVQTVLREAPSRASKARHLARLRDRGVCLIDLKTDPKIGNERLDEHVPDLVARAVALAPEHVITVKANVCDLCQPALRAAGLGVADVRIPFPGSGQQGRFCSPESRTGTSKIVGADSGGSVKASSVTFASAVRWARSGRQCRRRMRWGLDGLDGQQDLGRLQPPITLVAQLDRHVSEPRRRSASRRSHSQTGGARPAAFRPPRRRFYRLTGVGHHVDDVLPVLFGPRMGALGAIVAAL